MRPLHRLAIALVGVIATVAVLVAVDGTDEPRPSAGPATPSPTIGSAAPPLGPPTTIAGPPFGVAEADPTRSAAQSKVWFNDGRWWAVLWAAASGESRIHVLDAAAGSWVDTGQVVDERPGSRADVLAEDDRIVVATAGPNPDSARDAVRIVEFVYDAERETYGLAPDFPLELTAHGVDSVVLARDGTGRLWATYVHQGRLLVDRTDGDDHRWLGSLSPGGDGTARQATIVALSDRVVVLSTGTSSDALEVWIHRDRDAAESWLPVRHEVRGLRASPAPLVARAARDASGEAVFAVARTTLDRTDVNALAPLVLVFRLGPDGDLRSFVFGRVADHHREPTIAIDEDAGRAYVFATTTIGDARAIVVKAADLENPVFDPGIGTVFASSAGDRLVSTPSAPRQPIGAAGGIAVLAADDGTDRYVTGVVDVPVRPVPAASAEHTLVNDTFEAWPAGSTLRSLWRVATDGQPSSGTIETGAGAADRALALVADAAGSGPRACRPFGAVQAGSVRATVELRPGVRGTTDGGIWLRGDGEQGASIRFEDTGTLSAYDGATKVRSTVAWTPRTWYRVELDATVEAKTYAWRIVERDSGRAVLAGNALAWRSPLAASVDEICIDAPSGVAGLDLWIDSVLVVAR